MTQAFLTEIVAKETSVGTMYDLVFNNGDKVGAGKFMPKNVTAGKYYDYGVTMKGQYKNLTPGSIKEIPAPAGGAAPAAAPTVRSSGGGFDDRQEIISRQAAANTALAFMAILQAADALPVPTAGKKAGKADVLEAIAHEYIGKFYKLATRQEFVLPEGLEEAGDLATVDAATTWDE